MLGWKTIPRNVKASWLQLMSNSCWNGTSSPFSEPILIQVVFSRLGFSPENFAYWSTSDRAAFRDSLEPSSNIAVSSAYCKSLYSLLCTKMPLMFTLFRIIIPSISAHSKKMYGELGSPCLQPRPISKNSEKMPFCIPHNLMSLRIILIRCLNLSPKLKKFKTLKINFQDTESKAFSKSSNKTSPGML